ncbi:MAG: ATP-binding protein [Propionibacteriaceae bacterium]|jgi:predicted AAA+ superfamily ATPase|nr:ATP-binding protein [Propionibacteriaceae bacterium]
MTTWIPRQLDLADRIRPNRATIIHGPRRAGKTSLVDRHLATLSGQRILRASGDNIVVRDLLSGQDAARILAWTEGYDLLFLDEAQRIPEVGWGLKILVDSRPELTVIATGSASFALAGAVGEPLTGGQTPLTLFPISVGELRQVMNDYELSDSLDNFLVYGMYPEVRTSISDTDRRDVVRELTNSYLFKDILELDRVKHTKALQDLLTLIALQVGSLVSINELASTLGIDAKTISRYLDLFEKSYILYNLRGFSRNLRQEVTRTSKYYFWDTGIRNAVLNNFNPLQARGDVGALWENFVIIERLKALSYARQEPRLFFWRTWSQQEIDLIEEADGGLHAYAIKWNPKARSRRPSEFARAYPDASFTVVTPDTLLDITAPEGPETGVSA